MIITKTSSTVVKIFLVLSIFVIENHSQNVNQTASNLNSIDHSSNKEIYDSSTEQETAGITAATYTVITASLLLLLLCVCFSPCCIKCGKFNDANEEETTNNRRRRNQMSVSLGESPSMGTFNFAYIQNQELSNVVVPETELPPPSYDDVMATQNCGDDVMATQNGWQPIAPSAPPIFEAHRITEDPQIIETQL